MKTKNKAKKCEYLKCPYEDKQLSIIEKTSAFNHLGAKAAYVTSTWFLLGNFLPGQSFFSSTFMISASLTLGYLQYTPEESYRKTISRIGLFSSVIWGVISFICIISTTIEGGPDATYAIFKTHIALKGVSFSLYNAWLIMGITLVVLPIADWVLHVCLCEKQDILKIDSEEA